MIDYDRTEEDVGNVLALEHVNTCVPDQQVALSFYVNGLGLTRDPYLMTGSKNMWINVGTSQFHLPTRSPQVLRGHTGIVMPDRDALLARLTDIRSALSGTKFSYAEEEDYVDVTCPWGNRMRCYEPRAEFGKMQLGIAYVELSVPIGSAHGIAEFYDKVMGAKAAVAEESGVRAACVTAGINQVLRFREIEEAQSPFDGHHIAIYIADFSGPYRRLIERNLISLEANQHEYRFVDIIDLETSTSLFQVEHEVRSMRHPMYARRLVNREPGLTVRNFLQSREDLAPASD